MIYHGRRKWDIPLSLDIDQPISSLQKHFSKLEYLLFDFSHTPDEKIIGSPQLRLTLMALKYVRTRSIIKKIDLFLVILKEMINEVDIAEYIDELSLYIDSATPSDLREKVLDRIKTAIITGEDRMSSIKEYFKQEGIKEGIEKGMKQGTEKGLEQVALNMLKNGESTEKIALYTGLSKEKIASLQKQIDEQGVRNFLCKLVYSAGVFNATNNITA